ncbi:hypothetical protein NQ176_g4629 [Zarea fungicola]|uniref:Uncharacterized protein n=1 Tax=Zarea fungicola TaxID=93591 RepID=A0ACC1NDJ0_9HYPO|nr:hypothetical protein NQ176_g4629 [Lecanicillium fungicola]
MRLHIYPVVFFVSDNSEDGKLAIKKLKAPGYKLVLVPANHSSFDKNKVNFILYDEANRDSCAGVSHKICNLRVSLSDMRQEQYYNPARDDQGTMNLTLSRHSDDGYKNAIKQIQAAVQVHETFKKLWKRLEKLFEAAAKSVTLKIEALIELAIQPEETEAALETIQAFRKLQVTLGLETRSKDLLEALGKTQAAMEKMQTLPELATRPDKKKAIRRKLQVVLGLADQLRETEEAIAITHRELQLSNPALLSTLDKMQTVLCLADAIQPALQACDGGLGVVDASWMQPLREGPPSYTACTGPRSVSTLTPSQLARKRANDREAQRAIRARTKEHIERVEEENEGLKEKNKALEEKYKALEEKYKALEQQLRINQTGNNTSHELQYHNRVPEEEICSYQTGNTSFQELQERHETLSVAVASEEESIEISRHNSYHPQQTIHSSGSSPFPDDNGTPQFGTSTAIYGSYVNFGPRLSVYVGDCSRNIDRAFIFDSSEHDFGGKEPPEWGYKTSGFV